MKRCPLLSWWFPALVLAVAIGCSSERRPEGAGSGTKGSEDASDSSSAAADEGSAEGDKPFQLGDMIEPFDPPPLAELDKTAEWVDHTVLDGMDVLRQQQEALGRTPLTVEEALALRNDSPEDNEKILITLGRIAPADRRGVAEDATWVRHVSGDLKSSNPVMKSSITEFEYQALTAFNKFGLLNTDRDLNYFAPKESIVSWQTSKDHKIDKFVLRDDMTWSDGAPITAHDAEFTFKLVMSEAVPVPALRQNMIQIKAVKAYDDLTLVIFHKEAMATNIPNLNEFAVLPKHVYEKTVAADPTLARSEEHSRLEDHPVVGGAYELVSRVRNQEFVLKRRESYYMYNGKQVRPKPYFTTIRTKVMEDLNTALLAMKAGQIEQMELRAENWFAQANDAEFYKRNTKVTAVEWTEFHFVWNLKTPYFADKRVREAMSWAMDYDEMLHTICRDLYAPSQGPFHPTDWAFPRNGPQPYHQDLNKAEELLEAAGWTDSDGDGVRDKLIDGRRVPFEFTLITFTTETPLQVCTLMKECLGKIGVTCYVKPTEFTVLTEAQRTHKFDAAMGGWGSGSDPDTSANIYATDEGRNYGGYSNPRVDELYEKGRREFDPEKRAAIYGEIHNELWQDQPYTWLFCRNAFYAFSKKLRGYSFSPTGPFYFNPGIFGVYQAAPAP